jgi:AraC-like DNA-binding protein
VTEHIVVTILSTDGLRPNEREPFWRHVMSDTFAPVAIHSMAAGNVAGSIDARRAGRLMIADVRSTGQDIRRTPRQIGDADNAYFQVAVVADGVGRVSQDDRQAVLWDSTLGPDEIAAAVNISTRYLHKLFEAEHHHTVSLYIRARRLELARRTLLDPRLADRSISTIAYSCGFVDLSRFNRAFRAAFGVTRPSCAARHPTRHIRRDSYHPATPGKSPPAVHC